MFFFKNLLYSGAWPIQTKCIVMMTKEGSTKIVKFITPGAGVLVLGCGNMVNMHYLSTVGHGSDKLSIKQ